ncbi:hypothetical protein Pmi06nite_15870 [Planotetraspora mira]|uniref:Uncharacterized protein n=1 Tax=Planotetraspora mira TaxID=58121 RepID=A0A8J3X540_9ACTN|nr:hypothetical protein Pmi06nite_15870 [Planotetraspora mira]
MPVTVSANRSTRVPVLCTVARDCAPVPGSAVRSVASSSIRMPVLPPACGRNAVCGCLSSAGACPDQERYAPQPGFAQNRAPGGLLVPQLAQFIGAPG